MSCNSRISKGATRERAAVDGRTPSEPPSRKGAGPVWAPLPSKISGVAAAKQITPVMEAEILRRRAAREPVTSIAADFDLAHQTVSKLAKRDAIRRAAGLERQAQARAEHERHSPQERIAKPAKQIVRHPLLPRRLQQLGRTPRLLRAAQARIRDRLAQPQRRPARPRDTGRTPRPHQRQTARPPLEIGGRPGTSLFDHGRRIGASRPRRTRSTLA